jgi:D-beta-D-heptose 7-phosphate kinase / D-beta-D-heptose 1-phosphate adenosyltransferase
MICPDFSGLKILVVGDPMLDEYIFGHVDRVSPEAPVPVFIPDDSDMRHGGAANVLRQLIVLGCDTRTAWGDESWTYKTRYMVGSHQLLRVDLDRCVPNRIPALEGFSAVVISDYAKGACTPEVCSQVIASGLPVIVDPKGADWTKYKGAKVICPNHLEVQPWDGTMVEKRGADGLRIHWSDVHTQDFPSTAKAVFDVCGAGDTVTAVIAACLAAKVSLPDACRLANLAAGYVVGEVGTTVCPIEKLKELCASA